jgi:hypothetical protein
MYENTIWHTVIIETVISETSKVPILFLKNRFIAENHSLKRASSSDGNSRFFPLYTLYFCNKITEYQ